MNYLVIKHIHMTAVALSGLLFFSRGLLMLRDSALLEQRLWRIGPHVVDTVLLASAVTLAVLSGQYPFVQPWLTAKVLALIVYIVIGAIALKRGKTKAIRSGAFVVALLLFAYIVKVALTKQAF